MTEPALRENPLLEAEYSAMRDEILLLEQEQFRSLRYGVLAAGIIAAWVTIERDGLGLLAIPSALLPLLILRAAAVWMGRIGVTIERIGQYLRKMEASAQSATVPGWQHYKDQNGFERLDHWDHAARYIRILNFLAVLFAAYMTLLAVEAATLNRILDAAGSVLRAAWNWIT